MAPSQICFASTELAYDAVFHWLSMTVTTYGAASSNDGKMNSHSLKTFSPGEVMDP